MVGAPFFIYHKRMGYVHFNNNPLGKNTGDCVIRALSVITGLSWDGTYDELSEVVHDIGELPADNTTWSEYLKRLGYVKEVIPDTCPMCYTVRDFCREHPKGVYVLATGSHVVAVVDGNYIDSWDSGLETPIFYWRQR